MTLTSKGCNIDVDVGTDADANVDVSATGCNTDSDVDVNSTDGVTVVDINTDADTEVDVIVCGTEFDVKVDTDADAAVCDDLTSADATNAAFFGSEISFTDTDDVDVDAGFDNCPKLGPDSETLPKTGGNFSDLFDNDTFITLVLVESRDIVLPTLTVLSLMPSLTRISFWEILSDIFRGTLGKTEHECDCLRNGSTLFTVTSRAPFRTLNQSGNSSCTTTLSIISRAGYRI